jgi:hypothetical protein
MEKRRWSWRKRRESVCGSKAAAVASGGVGK